MLLQIALLLKTAPVFVLMIQNIMMITMLMVIVMISGSDLGHLGHSLDVVKALTDLSVDTCLSAISDNLYY